LQIRRNLNQERSAEYQGRRQQVDHAGADEAERSAHQHRTDGDQQGARPHGRLPGTRRSGPNERPHVRRL